MLYISFLLLQSRVLSVELGNPVAELLASSIENGLTLRGSGVGGNVVVAVSSALDNEDGSLGGALERTSGTALPRDGGGSPRVELSVDPEEALGLDVAPSTSVLVNGVVGLAGLHAVLVAVLVGELSVASQLDIVLPSVVAGQHAGLIKTAP